MAFPALLRGLLLVASFGVVAGCEAGEAEPVHSPSPPDAEGREVGTEPPRSAGSTGAPTGDGGATGGTGAQASEAPALGHSSLPSSTPAVGRGSRGAVGLPDAGAPLGDRATTPGRTGPSDRGDPPVDSTLDPPDPMRGIYLNAWVSGSRGRSEALLELARRTEVNTFVIDVKDASGFVSYPTRVEMAREVGADREIRIRNVRELLERVEAAGVWPIARIVVFKDPILARARPDLAVQDSSGAAWVDGKGELWVNPWEEEVWSYHYDLAREAIELGFREIQWDYVRFPDRPASEMASAVFRGGEGRERVEAVRDFLAGGREELAPLAVPITADLFGVVTTARGDVGIGQVWEPLVQLVDAALPMVYPSHYWEGSYGLQDPNDRPYEVVKAALGDALRRNEVLPGAGRVIPWLQDFTLGAPPYGVAEVRAQILATYDAGIQDWILWNASGRYTEGALKPVEGWPEGTEPEIRIAGVVVPAAERFTTPVEAAGSAQEEVAPADRRQDD